jgi:poly(3-hydroxybutyrate) depolymerase
MASIRLILGAAMVAIALTACGSNTGSAVPSTDTAHGTLVVNPPLRLASVDNATLQGLLSASASGQQLLQLIGGVQAGLAAIPGYTPSNCGIDVYYLKYRTLGAAGEATESSGALMVPTGATAGCSGPRPILLYAHGTNTNKALNIANLQDPTNTEGALIAAMYAAQGYIVVAPNYAGYDISTLGYHPYVLAQQQSGEMLDILAAARSALPKTFTPATSDSGGLYITGYSEGGYVALATARALDLQTPGQYTAVAPMSGPHALEAYVDTIFLLGQVGVDDTVFAPFITTSYNKAYGTAATPNPVFQFTGNPTDVYESAYASGITTLLPSTTPIDTIIGTGLLPPTGLFSSTAIGAGAFQPPLTAMQAGELAGLLTPQPPPSPFYVTDGTNLIQNSFRASYALDAFTNQDAVITSLLTSQPLAPTVAAAPPSINFLRWGLYMNDLRNNPTPWVPSGQTMLCGGQNDPTVYFLNSEAMGGYWAYVAGALPSAYVLLSVDTNPNPMNANMTAGTGPFAALQNAFAAEYNGDLAVNGYAQAQEDYHGTLVPPICAAAVFEYFLAPAVFSAP